MPRQEANWAPADVTAAVLAFMNEVGELHRSWDIDYARIRHAVGAPVQLPNHLHQQLSEQIMRSLNKLAEQGELIKYKKDEHLPWDKPGVRLNNPCWFTPAAHERVRSEGEAIERQRVDYIQWREQLMVTLKADYDILARIEFYGAGNPDEASVCIPRPDWDKLLKLAALGASVEDARGVMKT